LKGEMLGDINSLISIIVPVYNAEQHLTACIQSIVSQDYANLEIILVNDGSTDKSADICDDYARRDKRVKVYHIENGGAAHARNFGLNKTNGQYVVFVDADDYIELTYIDKLYSLIKDGTVKLGICSYNEVIENGNKCPQWVNDSLSDDLFMDYGKLGFRLYVPWGKIYDLSIIRENNIFFPEDMTTAEDQMFNDKYFRYVHKYSYDNECLYNYRIGNSNSLSNKKNTQSFYSEKKILKFKRMFFDDCYVKDKEHILLNRLVFLAIRYNKIDNDCYKIAIYDNYEGYTFYERLKIYMLKRKIVFPFVLYRHKWRLYKKIKNLTGQMTSQVNS